MGGLGGLIGTVSETNNGLMPSINSTAGVSTYRVEKRFAAGELVKLKTNLHGLLSIRNETTGDTAIIALNVGYKTQIITGSGFSTVKDLEDRICVYFNNESLYTTVIQNNTNGPKVIKYSVL